jgi:hypothetical protein
MKPFYIVKLKRLVKEHAIKAGHKFNTRFYSCTSFDQDVNKWMTGHYIRCCKCKKEFRIRIYEDSRGALGPFPPCKGEPK